MTNERIKKSFLFILSPPSTKGIRQHPTLKCSNNYYTICLSRLQEQMFIFTQKKHSMMSVLIFINYLMISEIFPEPTVLPPSRIENLVPFSIAIGAINSTVISTLSPGITISTPSGNSITPVTSVVLK